MNRRRMITTAAVIAACIAGCGGGRREDREEARPVETASAPLNVNLVENPSFETWNGAVPASWKLEHFEGSGNTMNQFGPSNVERRSGAYSFHLRGTFNVDKWMILTQRHPVLPKHRLWFAADMKCRDLKKSRGQTDRACVFVRFYDRNGKRVSDRYWADAWTRSLSGTLDWRTTGKRVDVPKEAHAVEIGLVSQLTGWIYFDDVELVLEAPVPWRTIETKLVDFHYLEGHPFPDGAIERQTNFIEATMRKLKLDPGDEGKIGYYFYPSDEAFKEIKGFKIGPDHTRVSAGLREIHTTKSYEDHMMIHLLLEPLGYPPYGLSEGAVFYVLGSWEGGLNLHMMAKQLLLEKRLPALFHLLKHRAMEQAGMSIAVPGWSSFCIWLIDRHGVEKFLKLYASMNNIEDAGPFNVRFKDVYGKDFEEMDRQWRLWVLRYQPKL